MPHEAEADPPQDLPAQIRFEEFERVLGAKVRQLREQRGWSQTDLANRLADLGLEMHQTTVAKMEVGRRPLRVSEAVAVAHAFDIPANTFFWLPVPGETRSLAQAREELEESERRALESEEALLGAVRTFTELHATNKLHVREMADLIERSRRLAAQIDRARAELAGAEAAIRAAHETEVAAAAERDSIRRRVDDLGDPDPEAPESLDAREFRQAEIRANERLRQARDAARRASVELDLRRMTLRELMREEQGPDV